MELDLFPRRKRNLRTANELPEGMTHSKDDRCPFNLDDFPTGKHGTCCSLHGKAVVEHLEAFGETDAANLMHANFAVGGARAFSSTLRSAAIRIEQRFANRKDKSKGVTRADGSDIETETASSTQPSTEEAVASIRQAADWYQKVGRLGFGVYARH